MLSLKRFMRRIQLIAKREINARQGFKLLADQMDLPSPTRLHDALNPDRPKHVLRVEWLLEIMQRTTAQPFLDLLCDEFDFLAVPPPPKPRGGGATQRIERLLLEVAADAGAVSREFLAAQAEDSEGGKDLTPAEVARIEAKLKQSLARQWQLQRVLKEQAHPLKEAA